MIRPHAMRVFAGVLVLLGFEASRAVAADLDPELRGKWPPFGSLPEAIAVEGAYAYCLFPAADIGKAAGTGLGIFDVSRPAAPTLVGRYQSPEAQDVFVLENHAYLADLREGLVILDVSDPARPRRVGADLLGVQRNGEGGNVVFVSGRHAYVRGGGDNRLHVVDVSDPADPRRLGLIDGVIEVGDVFGAGDLALRLRPFLVLWPPHLRRERPGGPRTDRRP